MVESNPDFVRAIIASMFVGNVILLLLNLPLARPFAKLLQVPYALLYRMILAPCIAGVYSQVNGVSDLWPAATFGVISYFMRRLSRSRAKAAL